MNSVKKTKTKKNKNKTKCDLQGDQNEMIEILDELNKRKNKTTITNII